MCHNVYLIDIFRKAKCLSWPATRLTPIISHPPHCSSCPNIVIDLTHTYEQQRHNDVPVQRVCLWHNWQKSSCVCMCVLLTWKIQGVRVLIDLEVKLACCFQLILALNGSAVIQTYLQKYTQAQINPAYRCIHTVHNCTQIWTDMCITTNYHENSRKCSF